MPRQERGVNREAKTSGGRSATFESDTVTGGGQSYMKRQTRQRGENRQADGSGCQGVGCRGGGSTARAPR